MKIDKFKRITPSILHNPLEPYYKHFHGSFTTYNNDDHNKYYEDIAQRFAKEGRPLNNQEYKELFKKYINLKNFMNEDKAPILKKIWEDAKIVNDAFEPLKKLNVDYTLDLTGGSVRDFILNKHKQIKDLDFMVSILGRNIPKADDLLTIFSQEELDTVQWEDAPNYQGEELEKVKVNLIRLCMNRTQLVTHHYNLGKKRTIVVNDNPQTYNEESNSKKPDRLFGLIKMSGKKLNYPVELLLTDLLKPEFLQEFDLDICKVSFCFVNKSMDKSFPKDHSHLVSRFSGEVCFFADVKNKKVTFDCDKRGKSEIIRSLGNHLDRILLKYPDSKLNLTSEYAINYEFAKSLALKAEITQELGKKDLVKVKKNKI